MRRGLGTDIGYVNIVGPGEGVGRQRFGILYFGRGGSVRGVWGQTLMMLISGGGGLRRQIWGMFILCGVEEFWDRHWRC